MDEVAKEVRYVGTLMEQMSHEVKAVHELVAAQPTVADFHRLENKVDDLSQRMGTVEATVKATNRDLAAHKNDEIIHFMPSDGYRRHATA